MDHHYLVVSGEIEYRGSDFEPPEIFRCVCYVTAPNKRKARHLAVKDREMRDWVDEKRGNGECPFAGLTVEEVDEYGGPIENRDPPGT